MNTERLPLTPDNRCPTCGQPICACQARPPQTCRVFPGMVEQAGFLTPPCPTCASQDTLTRRTSAKSGEPLIQFCECLACGHDFEVRWA